MKDLMNHVVARLARQALGVLCLSTGFSLGVTPALYNLISHPELTQAQVLREFWYIVPLVFGLVGAGAWLLWNERA